MRAVTGRLKVEPDAGPGTRACASTRGPDDVPAAKSAPSRVAIANVEPDVDGGRYAVKRVVGDEVEVAATIFAEGHHHLGARLRVRRCGDAGWREVPMVSRPNDRWEATFVPDALGAWEFTIEGWVDDFASWRWGLGRKLDAGQDVAIELVEGATLVRAAAERADGADAAWLGERARRLAGEGAARDRGRLALEPELAARMARHPDRSVVTILDHVVRLEAERERAAFGAWYECFPRSCAAEPGRPGTLRDLTARLPYVAGMGFDVLYLPPIHPIGVTHRKGRNNALDPSPGDPGSPWAIGAREGGHTAVHPALGTLADFDALVAAARRVGLEIALDVAFQCSPDHPYVTAHPEWFRTRPDGSIQYAENPPKRYQDIYPFDFEGAAWRELWTELRDVVLFWVRHGVTIFRVDNPHTKPFAFWEWMIAEVRQEHPEVFFLAEAFTRPAVMRHLAKIGFSQSYTYFTWRNTKAELTTYLTELTQGPVREYMRGNLFANTPDILHAYLQTGGPPAFKVRFVLAATLGGSYGIYGPPFELCVGAAMSGTEEYLDSEKYEVRHWNLDAPESLQDLVARVNAIRRENAAFRHDCRLRFLPVDDEQLLAYAKSTPDLSNVIVVVVNLDPHHPHAGHLELPLAEFGIDATEAYQMDDLLGGAHYFWHGPRGYVALDPHTLPAHVFRVRRRIRTERDFDYYL
jgi:starch synthase (maltosyl-transferring)